jgi:hypothetical protein
MGPAGAAAPGRPGAMVVSAALTVSGDAVIVLLRDRRNVRERLYAYVTVAYETVG